MDRQLRRLAWINLIICLGLLTAGVILYFLNQPAPAWRRTYDLEIWSLAAWATLFPLVALLILANRPRHVIGWLLGGIGLLASLTVLATQYGIFGLYTQPHSLPHPSFFLWLRSWLWMPTICLLALLFLLFPTGQLPSRRWRWIAYALLLVAFASLAINLPGLANLPTVLSDAPTRNPPWTQIATSLLLVLLISLVASISSLWFRWREADALVREQIKWVVFAGLVVGVAFLLGDAIVERIWQEPAARLIAGRAITSLAIAFLAGSIFIAIARYRLFDIDVIIRRTLQYTLITGLLALIYFGVVVVLQQVFTRLTGQSSTAAVVLSTLAIAALFNSVRRRVQDAVDRRFFRRKYDAEQVLQQFAATARDETDLDALTAELVRVIQETMQPQSVSVWLRPVATMDNRQQTTDDRPRPTFI